MNVDIIRDSMTPSDPSGQEVPKIKGPATKSAYLPWYLLSAPGRFNSVERAIRDLWEAKQ